MYVELHTASAFSFLDGASLPEHLVARAAALGYPAIALLDRDTVSGIPRFHQAAVRAGLKALVGAELTMSTQARTGTGEGRPAPAPGARRRGANPSAVATFHPHPPMLWRLPVLVASREGYRNLCRLITRMKLGAPKGEGTLTLDDLAGHTRGLVALAGRVALNAAYYGVGGMVDRLVGLFEPGHVYVEVQRHLLRDEEADNQALAALASAYHLPLVATGGVRFATEAERPLYDVLTCLRHQTTISRAGRRLSVNAERYLKAPDAMAALFADRPEALQHASALADRLEYTMADLGYRFPDYPVPAGETQISFLRKIAEVGARDRYRPYHERARRQVAREMDLIEKLDLAGYFLIVWDIVNVCRQRGILVQGRGSAANSAVCYSLGITAVDPVGMDLLFERFLSEERGEWPDIDLDLPSGERREQAIQYVYERYGKLGAAMTANVITYRGRSAAREVGKVLEMDEPTIDRMARGISPFEWQDPKETMARHLADAGLDARDRRFVQFADLWARMQDLPRHLGQHSGGMVICQGRLDEVVPLEPATMPDRVVIQWDKEDCADMGIVKVDLLGLGMMAVLQDAITMVNAQAGARSLEPGVEGAAPSAPSSPSAQCPVPSAGSVSSCLDLAHLPPDDPVVYRMLQEADTIGIFQVESRAQMATLPRLKPRTFYDLVVEVAIIRPGPIVGQMVHPYLNRRAGREPVAYPHPSLEPILKRTLGVPLFQEQLLRIAMVAADFTGGEAEELRRAMGFKRSEARMREIEKKLRAGMARKGITPEAADAIVLSITSFALYGFPESHAASFALLVYASAYLKAHYPSAFYAALLNNQPMGFYHPATIVKDGQRHGVRFRPVDVQVSDWLCRVEADSSVRLGLCYVRGLRRDTAERIASVAPGSPDPRIAGSPDPPSARRPAPSAHSSVSPCPKCGADDPSMLDRVDEPPHGARGFCNVCAHDWPIDDRPPRGHQPAAASRQSPLTSRESEARREPEAASRESEARREPEASTRFRSVEHLVRVAGLHKDEVAVLASIGALNSLGHDRRSALWQVERVVRPSGELFREDEEPPVGHLRPERASVPGESVEAATSPTSPLRPMTPLERLVADYSGTGLSVGPHPMALKRAELALRGVLRATDLPHARAGRRVRVAGAVITRQRPGTAKGFVFLTLEDETGISNVIVRPDVFTAQRGVIVHESFVLVEGVLQQQDGVASVRAERVEALSGRGPTVESHDFK